MDECCLNGMSYCEQVACILGNTEEKYGNHHNYQIHQWAQHGDLSYRLQVLSAYILSFGEEATIIC